LLKAKQTSIDSSGRNKADRSLHVSHLVLFRVKSKNIWWI